MRHWRLPFSGGVSWRQLTRRLALALMISVTWATASPPALAQGPRNKVLDKETIQSKRAKLKNEIEALNQDLTCESHSDCDVLEMGVKPCGGPWRHLTYSKKNTKASALKRKVSDYNGLDKSFNEASNIMSDCGVQLPPEVRCVEKACKIMSNEDLRPAAPGETSDPSN